MLVLEFAEGMKADAGLAPECALNVLMADPRVTQVMAYGIMYKDTREKKA